MNDLLGNDLDLKNIDNVLHVLRNPHGWNDHVVRDARLAAADEIERLHAALNGLLTGDVGRQTLHKLATGQGTDTDDGRAWLRAAAMVTPNLNSATRPEN